MDLLFPRKAFTGFGTCQLQLGSVEPAFIQVRAYRSSGLKQKVRQLCPREPGVYGMIDRRGELIYVGKAKVLRNRLLSYFRAKSRGRKAGRIIRHVRSLVWEPASSEFAALLRELELIRRWQPRFNVHGQPWRYRRLYICLGRKPVPYLYLTARPKGRDVEIYGPVPAHATASEAIRRLNDWFGLRNCPQSQKMTFQDQAHLFPVELTAGCLRYEIGTCLGPCAAGCSRRQYGQAVTKARQFVSGQDSSLLNAIRKQMVDASAQLAFERAAAIRDQFEAIAWLWEQIEKIKSLRSMPSTIYEVTGTKNQTSWYLIHGGQVVAILGQVRKRQEREQLSLQVRKLCRKSFVGENAIPRGDLDGVLLVSAWFRKHPDERQRLVDPLTFEPLETRAPS